MADSGIVPLNRQELARAWRDTEKSLPDDVELCGVVYHGPDRVPGTEWIAFACDSRGNALAPEGVGIDPFSALKSLVDLVTQRDT